MPTETNQNKIHQAEGKKYLLIGWLNVIANILLLFLKLFSLPGLTGGLRGRVGRVGRGVGRAGSGPTPTKQCEITLYTGMK